MNDIKITTTARCIQQGSAYNKQ